MWRENVRHSAARVRIRTCHFGLASSLSPPTLSLPLPLSSRPRNANATQERRTTRCRSHKHPRTEGTRHPSAVVVTSMLSPFFFPLYFFYFCSHRETVVLRTYQYHAPRKHSPRLRVVTASSPHATPRHVPPLRHHDSPAASSTPPRYAKPRRAARHLLPRNAATLGHRGVRSYPPSPPPTVSKSRRRLASPRHTTAVSRHHVTPPPRDTTPPQCTGPAICSPPLPQRHATPRRPSCHAALSPWATTPLTFCINSSSM